MGYKRSESGQHQSGEDKLYHTGDDEAQGQKERPRSDTVGYGTAGGAEPESGEPHQLEQDCLPSLLASSCSISTLRVRVL